MKCSLEETCTTREGRPACGDARGAEEGSQGRAVLALLLALAAACQSGCEC
jgi:hypothetical protein